MKTLPRTTATAWCAVIGLLVPGWAPAEDAAIVELKARFTEALARAEQPQTELDAKYRENLEALFNAERGKGNLEGALAVKKEMDGYKAPGERQLDAWPELKRMRDIYEAASERVDGQIGADRLRLHEAYRQELRNHLERLTREGKLEEAVRLSTEVKGIDKMITELQAARPGLGEDASAKVLWEFKSRASVEMDKGIEIKTQGDGYVLSSKSSSGARITSRKTFKPPFRISTRVATDSTNIRIYFNDQVLVIFNWELNPAELRIHEPKTGRNLAFRDKGFLERNQMHDIVIDVLDDKVVARANGRQLVRAEARSDGVEGPVGLGPAFGSILTMESMQVIDLSEP